MQHPETYLRPPIQCLAINPDRLLVRMPGAQFVLRGTGIEDLANLVELMDGSRSRANIVRALQDRYAPEAVQRTLDLLRQRQTRPPQDSLEAEPSTADIPSTTSTSRVFCFANQTLYASLRARLPDPVQLHHSPIPQVSITNSPDFWQCPDRNPSTGENHFPTFDWTACDLVVCLADGEPYAVLRQIQEKAKSFGVPCLFAFQTALGWELTVTSKGSPCLGCAQQTLYQSAFGRQPVFPMLDQMRTFPWPSEDRFCLDLLVKEIAISLDPGTSSQNAGAVLRRLHGSKNLARLPVTHSPHCSLCSKAGNDPALSGEAAYSGRSGMTKPNPETTPNNVPTDQMVRQIGIIGGGTAGYLTALALRAKHPQLQISLIESPKVNVIGVGEATTPLMLQFLHLDLGLDIHDFFTQVEPTFKLGIRFDWGPNDPAFFHYPFGSIHPVEALRYEGDIRFCNRQAMLMTAGKLPVHQGPDGHFQTDWDCNIAYHLDNRKFVAYLQRTALSRGIQHILAHVDSVETTPNGDEISSLTTECGQRLSFDLYIDCSGFKSMLMNGALGSPFQSYQKSLFTDSALIANVHHLATTPPFTRAITMDAGWCWNTPQRDAHHCGYVFASDFISAQEAEREMRRLLPTMGEARCLKFQSGRHREFWKGNVVAMGNAYGFVEPLESTALHMLIRQIGLLSLALPIGRLERHLPKRLNQRVGDYWDYLRFFLALHYRFNTRKTTPFWKFCRERTELGGHRHLLEAFETHGPLAMQPDLNQPQMLPDPLWDLEGIDLLLLAQGKTGQLPPPTTSEKSWRAKLARHRKLTSQALPQKEALETLARHPQLLQNLLKPFRQFGPAFQTAT